MIQFIKENSKLLLNPLLMLIIYMNVVLIYSCSEVENSVRVELVDSVQCWVSPGWGNNAPKIVQNKKGDIWIASLEGSYQNSKASLYKRLNDGSWRKSSFQPDTYQPAMLFLDDSEHLNIVTNAQYEPVKHYRSKNHKNLDEFDLIASGNGIEDPRGWYVGVGINHNIMYMAYVSLNYDYWLTWKNVKDSVWSEPVKMYEGIVSSDGNHALLYPQFCFDKDFGYIMSSHTSDGSTYNFKDKVYLTTFSLKNPNDFIHEVIYECGRGYGNMGFGFITDYDQTLYCAFSGGVYYYGRVNDTALPEGNYLAMKNRDSTTWVINSIGNEKGMVAISRLPNGRIIAVMNDGSRTSGSQFIIKYSDNNGENWQEYIEKPLSYYDKSIIYPNYFQFSGIQSGSKRNDLNLFFTDDNYNEKTEEGLYNFKIYYMIIDHKIKPRHR